MDDGKYRPVTLALMNWKHLAEAYFRSGQLPESFFEKFSRLRDHR
jgi:hypothetical protein